MSTDLEHDLAAALRSRADAVPHTTCPPLGQTPRPTRRGWLVPVAAAAVAVLGIGVAAIALSPSNEPADLPPAAPQGEITPGEFYYSLSLTRTGVGDTVIETQLWQPQTRTGAWKRTLIAGDTITDGRVVPNDDANVEGPTAGECYPAEKPTDESCTAPAAWFNPTPEFLARAPRDPATIAQQLRAESTAEQERRTTPGGDFTESPETFRESNLTYLELNYLRAVLSANGLPKDLSQSLHQVVAAMHEIQVTENMANLVGERGTGYSLPNHKGELLTVIFNADGHYLGSPTEAVSHGIATALGEPPSRMLD